METILEDIRTKLTRVVGAETLIPIEMRIMDSHTEIKGMIIMTSTKLNKAGEISLTLIPKVATKREEVINLITLEVKAPWDSQAMLRNSDLRQVFLLGMLLWWVTKYLEPSQLVVLLFT